MPIQRKVFEPDDVKTLYESVSGVLAVAAQAMGLEHATELLKRSPRVREIWELLVTDWLGNRALRNSDLQMDLIYNAVSAVIAHEQHNAGQRNSAALALLEFIGGNNSLYLKAINQTFLWKWLDIPWIQKTPLPDDPTEFGVLVSLT